MDASDFRPASPVEADQHLWEDEAPFTEFGQFGEGQLDNRVFLQDVWWVDIHGKPHLLNEMSTEYLRNVLSHIFNNQEHFYDHMILRQGIEALGAMMPELTGLDPEKQKAYVDYLKTQQDALEHEPAEWAASTPLVQRINAILDSRVD